MLTDAERRVVIGIARRSVSARVAGAAVPPATEAGLPPASGVFVTLKQGGELRGCLGILEDVANLADGVARCAADASSNDPRFTPVTPPELPELSIEVSVLGPLERIDPASPHAITIGRHGLVIEQGDRRGVLLPQVASEWGWTPLQFLRQACVKATLAPDAWERGATVYRFDAEVFGE